MSFEENNSRYVQKVILTFNLWLVNRTWFCRYPHSQYIIYDNGSEFKLHFETLCETYGLTRKPTSVMNPKANAILERMHQTIMGMLRTAEIDMANTISENDIADFLTNATWAVRSTYHTVLKASPGAAIFGRDMLFDIPFIADWNKIGEYRQRQNDRLEHFGRKSSLSILGGNPP